MKALGIHIVGDLYECEESLLLKGETGEKLLNMAVALSGLNKIFTTSQDFEPGGYTAIVVLSESHISIHTWPELRAALIDVFTCGDEQQAFVAFDVLVDNLKPRRVEKKVLQRGTERKNFRQREVSDSQKIVAP